MYFHFTLCLLFKSIFSLQTAFVISVYIFRFRLYFVYMPIVKAVYNLLICTEVINFNFFSMRHFTVSYCCFFFMGKLLCSQKAPI